jgi:hypothetical protein
MIPNKERLQLEIAIRPHLEPLQVINIELANVTASIDRKFMQLDDFSASWSWSMWKNWKDAMQMELSYREYLLIILEAYKK